MLFFLKGITPTDIFSMSSSGCPAHLEEPVPILPARFLIQWPIEISKPFRFPQSRGLLAWPHPNSPPPILAQLKRRQR
jgi:hypothetical protein